MNKSETDGTPSAKSVGDKPLGRNLLISCCGAHIIQDGLVALHYVLLPILAQLFGLNYTQVGFLRAVGQTAMSVLEMPAGVLAERLGERRLMAFGLVFAGLGYLGVGFSSSFVFFAFFLIVAGIGAAFQHSLSSAIIVKNTHASARRQAMGAYNSAGDAGKLLFTALFSLAVGARGCLG